MKLHANHCIYHYIAEHCQSVKLVYHSTTAVNGNRKQKKNALQKLYFYFPNIRYVWNFESNSADIIYFM